MSKFPRIAVVTIEGGGAFGFSLLGQLQAVVESEIFVVALAGTSAGAIIATLHWAGYSPDKIKEKFCELADLKEITQQMGPFCKGADNRDFDFDAFHALKQDFESLMSEAAVAAKTAKGWRSWVPVMWKVPGVYAALQPHVKNRGLFSGEALVETLDRWLRDAPILDDRGRRALEAKRPRPGKITFGDLAEVTAHQPLRPLFLPITNVTKRQLEIVCSVDANYANWSVARSARASAGFPAFFQPVSFGHAPEESYYVDGGVIANYPAWIFGHQFRERLYQLESGRELAIRPWVHVGLCLGPPSAQEADGDRGRSAASFARCFARLLAGGARQELERRLVTMVSRTIEIRQPEDETDAPESLLDFATCDRTRIGRMFRRGRSAANERLAEHAYDHPSPPAVEKLLKELIAKALICLGQATPQGQPDNSRLQLRSNVFMPLGPKGDEWQVAFSANMNGDKDARLTLPKFAGLTGMCVGLRRPLVCNLDEVRNAAQEGVNTAKSFGMPPELHKLVRADRTWLASVPVFDMYASYPSRMGQDVQWFQGQYQDFEFGGDGAVMAVLNLDAALPYNDLQLNPKPEIHWTDVRIRSIIDVMRSVAADLATILSIAFGKSVEPKGVK